MIYSSFEDTPIWQQARKFVSKVYELTGSHYGHDYDLVRQFRRASVSITLNISEGFERRTNKDFARFLVNAKGSAGECRAILYISEDLGYLSSEKVKELNNDLLSISKQLSKFAEYLLKSNERKKSLNF